MRALKMVGIIVAAFIGLAVMAGLAVLLLVDPNAYRADIERLAQRQTGRPLHIGGKLDLKLFPWLAISIADVQLGNPPAYGDTAFVTIRKASVGVRLLPILRKRLEVSRVAVDGLTANLVSRSASDNNWKDLTEPKGGGAQKSDGGGAPQASIAGLEISNASLIYRDETKKSVTALSNLHLHTGAVGGKEPVDVTLEFDYGSGGSKPVAHVSIAGLARYSQQLAVRDLDVHGTLYGSASSAQPMSFSARSPSILLDMQAQSLAPATFTIQAGALNAQLSASGDKLFGDRVISGKVTMPRIAARSALASLGVSLPSTRDPQALSALALSSDYRLSAKQFQLTHLDLAIDETRLRGALALEDLDTMALGFDLNVDRIDLDRYLPPKTAPQSARQAVDKKAGAAGGDMRASATPLPIETLRKLDVRGTLQAGQAIFSGLTLTAVSLPLAAQGGRVHLGPTRAGLLGGTYNGDIVLDAAPAVAKVSLNEHVKGVDAGALMKAVFDTTHISGRGDGNVVVSGVGNTEEAILRSLEGKIDFNVRQGAVNGLDLPYQVQRAQALLQRQVPPAHAGPERTLFNTFSGSANLHKGVLRNDDLSIETDYLRTRGQGTLDLGTKAIDYRLVLSAYKLPPSGSGGPPGDAKLADVPLRVSGSLDNLEVRPDLEALAAAKVRQEVNDRLQGKSQELRKKLGDKLRDLLGR